MGNWRIKLKFPIKQINFKQGAKEKELYDDINYMFILKAIEWK